jgi:hypothetical protein
LVAVAAATVAVLAAAAVSMAVASVEAVSTVAAEWAALPPSEAAGWEVVQ